jgi:hypothetical protein
MSFLRFEIAREICYYLSGVESSRYNTDGQSLCIMRKGIRFSFRAEMEQLHDNGGAVGSSGVSHGGLQLHVPHQFKSTDSVLDCFTWSSGANPFSSSSFDSSVYPARVNTSTTWRSW